MTFIRRQLFIVASVAVSMSASAQQVQITDQISRVDSMSAQDANVSNMAYLAARRAPLQVDLSLMATAHSPAQPIAAFIKDWDAPLESGEHAYAQGRAALTVQATDSPISYGLAWRYDYLMSFNQQTADLYWQYQNKQIPNQSQTYELQLEAQHNERFGANVGFMQSLSPNWQLTTHANIWQGLHVLEGKANGSLTSQAIKAEEVVRNIDRLNKTLIYLDYYYDEPALGEEDLNWYPDKPKGYGYSLDINLTGKLSDKTQLSVRGYDILGRMHWKETPNTSYVLDYDINRGTTDKTNGQLETKDVTQTLPWRVEASLMHQLDHRWQLGAHGQVNDVQDLYQLSAGYLLNNYRYPFMFTALVEPQTKAMGLALDSQYGGVKVLTDDLDSEKAKRSEISLYGRYAW